MTTVGLTANGVCLLPNMASEARSAIESCTSMQHPADAAHLANGFKIYREDCVMCHAPAARQPTPMALGFNPQAPSFEENDMTVAQLFWVAKDGIRFTGMPAWGPFAAIKISGTPSASS